MKDYQYFALKVTNKDRENLINTMKNIFMIDNVEFLIDHVTLMHVSQHDDNLYNKLSSKLGERIKIVIDRIGQSDKATAFGVYLCSYRNMCKNKIPHITIMTSKDGKPVDSNYITDWCDIEPIIVDTILVKK